MERSLPAYPTGSAIFCAMLAILTILAGIAVF